MKFTFGDNTDAVNVIQISKKISKDLMLMKNQQLELQITSGLPLNVNIHGDSKVWYATTVMPGEHNNILEVLVPFTGHYVLEVEELDANDFIGTKKDKLLGEQ